jgi:di/tricarboxylate transporter
LAFGLVGLTILAFVWGRFRYDLVAVVALLAGMVVGVVQPEAAFDGFRNDIVSSVHSQSRAARGRS